MKIELDEDEVVAILDAVCNQIADLEDTIKWMGDDTEVPVLRERVQFLAELDMDLREQTWNRPEHRTLGTNDLTGLTFLVGEDDFVDAGIQARENMKQKLNDRLMRGTQGGVDIWSLDGLED